MYSEALSERLRRLWTGFHVLLAILLCLGAGSGLSGCATIEDWTKGPAAKPAPAAQPTSIDSPYITTAPTAGVVVEAWQAPPQEVRLAETTTFYRVWGGEARQLGSWLSPDRPTSRLQVRTAMALPPQNTAEFWCEVVVPAGTLMRVGVAAPAFGHPGGGRQVQLLELIPRESFREPQPLGP